MAPSDVSTLDVDRELVEGSVTGTLFSLPAGEVKASVSAVISRGLGEYIPSISIVTNDALGLNPSNPSSGETDTVEFGGEVLVPMFADSFNLTAGYRYSDQDISGSGDSWNVGPGVATHGKLLRERELPAGHSRSQHRRAVQRRAGQRIHGRRPDDQSGRWRSLRHQDGVPDGTGRRRGCRNLRCPGHSGGTRRHVPAHNHGVAGINRRKHGPRPGIRRHDHLRGRLAAGVRRQRPHRHARLLGHLD